ncbi:MAG: dihydroneopterin aldolase [Rhodospirillaceae bacterium]|jgi:dihydroneopterin aldolase|nr:dihydroneopterin aldolase [Rhodospirillales bacterium]MBT3906225.1 dihydroneopterin aldolase [Rhodospirillaceae bacterium]MBT4702257.1 dihydroneopterin aldolase [Rhodospirillaceae bacterium]MBT5033621.1 dihydroneopterin aldolase [Rhodospirillaceae bacterium]MBT6221500.1 dihydroneopterin aldolase [Rhodospirillaceae bacterium]
MTAESAKIVHPLKIADARNSLRHVFIRDLLLPCSIGVHQHEKTKPQQIRINLDLAVKESTDALNDQIENVVNYEEIVIGVRALIARGHVNLVETLADDIATMCLEDLRVRSVRVQIEKLDVFEDATSVGVEIERFSTAL